MMRRRDKGRGFTLIELLVVMAIIGILTAVAVPQLAKTPVKAREAALRENLYTFRTCLDQYYADKGHYPESLQTLVTERYIRKVPIDPFTKSADTWEVTMEEPDASEVSPDSRPDHRREVGIERDLADRQDGLQHMVDAGGTSSATASEKRRVDGGAHPAVNRTPPIPCPLEGVHDGRAARGRDRHDGDDRGRPPARFGRDAAGQGGGADLPRPAVRGGNPQLQAEVRPYPTSLKEMNDVRPRMIRRLWKDPITNSDDWGIVSAVVGAPLPGQRPGTGGPPGSPGAPLPTPTPAPTPASALRPRGRARSGRSRGSTRSQEESLSHLPGRDVYSDWRFTEQSLTDPAGGTTAPGKPAGPGVG